MSAVQLSLTQSLFSLHAKPSVQGGQNPPPQSVAVSFPSSIPSPHVETHFPDSQVLAGPQSLAALQFRPSPHAGQPPPQSTSG